MQMSHEDNNVVWGMVWLDCGAVCSRIFEFGLIAAFAVEHSVYGFVLCVVPSNLKSHVFVCIVLRDRL
jgi:hypothetical protein